MKSLGSAIVVISLLLAGCAGEGVNPCALLTLEEVRTLAPDAKESVWHKAEASRAGDNELCLWHDGGDENLFMLFYFLPPSVQPAELVKTGMSGREARTVDIEGVGDSASAGFDATATGSGGVLGLFAASAGGKTIGLRVRGIDDVSDERFQQLKLLANRVLSRI